MNTILVQKLMLKLKQFEHTEGIKIIHIAECDSRAWGFSTENSDYDLRFAYVRLPWACKINKTADTMRFNMRIEDTPVDMQGFDLQHVLRKISQGSLTIYEMFHSPLQIAHHEVFRPMFLEAIGSYTTTIDIINSCRGLMHKNFKHVHPYTAKAMLHALRFGLIADRLRNNQPIELNLPKLLLESKFKDQASEILASRSDLFWLPQESVSEYLHELLHSDDWPKAGAFVSPDEEWFKELNTTYQHIMRVVCEHHRSFTVDDLNW